MLGRVLRLIALYGRKQRGRSRLKPLPEASLYALLVYRITDAPLSQGCGNELWMVRQLRTIGQANINVTGWAG